MRKNTVLIESVKITNADMQPLTPVMWLDKSKNKNTVNASSLTRSPGRFYKRGNVARDIVTYVEYVRVHVHVHVQSSPAGCGWS